MGATAKKNRNAKLKQANEKAEEEVKAFRDDQDRKLKVIDAKAAADPSAELAGATKAEIDMVKRDYTQNKDKAIKYVVEKVLDVPTSLSETQMQALKLGTV